MFGHNDILGEKADEIALREYGIEYEELPDKLRDQVFGEAYAECQGHYSTRDDILEAMMDERRCLK